MKATTLAAALFLAACAAPEPAPEFTSRTFIAKDRGVEITATIGKVRSNWVAELQYDEVGKPTVRLPLARFQSNIFHVATPEMNAMEWIRITNGRAFIIEGNRLHYRDLDETFWTGKAVAAKPLQQ